MATKSYSKERFEVVGIINITNDTGKDGNYVLAKCVIKPLNRDDKDVVEGNNYLVFWELNSAKCDAPNPPFNTGEGIGVAEELLKIKYHKYCKNRFKIIGKFNPLDPQKYPQPENNGVYYIALCEKIHPKDKKVDKYTSYIIVVYPGSDFVDCPTPPFINGDAACI